MAVPCSLPTTTYIPPAAPFPRLPILVFTEPLCLRLRRSHRSHSLPTSRLLPLPCPPKPEPPTDQPLCAGFHPYHRNHRLPATACLIPQRRSLRLQTYSLHAMYGTCADLREPRQRRSLEDTSRSFREEITSRLHTTPFETPSPPFTAYLGDADHSALLDTPFETPSPLFTANLRDADHLGTAAAPLINI